MKRFYTNAAVKFLAFCLTALFSVGAVMLAFGAVNFAEQGCVPGQRYEDSAAYRSIMSGYIISAANLYRMQGGRFGELRAFLCRSAGAAGQPGGAGAGIGRQSEQFPL